MAVLTLVLGIAGTVVEAADLSATTYFHAGKLLDVRSGKMFNDHVMKGGAVVRNDSAR